MNYIKRILRLYENTKERAFSSWEISLFKSLNRNKEKLGTKKDYQSFISRYLEASGMDPREALYYYYVYSSNYRPDGQYDEIKKGEQKIPAFDDKAKRTSNVRMGEFAQNKIPFKGNNVEGFWEKDLYGEPQYVITSYNWYPIYIFKEGKWYMVSESYSPSTGKQMGQTRIYKNNTYMTAKEMAELRKGKDVSEIFKGKQENLTSELKKLLMGRQYQFATVYITPAAQVENLPRGDYRIKFSLNFIDKIGDDTVIDIDILEVALKNYQGQIVNRYSSNMLNDDIKQSIEKSLISWLEEKLDRSIRGVGNFKIDTEFKI
jgi:hypothetical protein